nr:cbb3-type cytochrome c oxidase subunit I [Candidatus Krumholzibacteria bacterium]
GPVDMGWTFITPFTLSSGGAFALLAFGLAFMALSWAATGINFIVTVHHKRAPGMGFFDMPILSWSLYLTGYILTLAGLVFGIIILYLASAKAGGKGLFAAGSNPLDWQNYFWFVTTPAAFFALLPAAGVISEVIVGISRKALSGYRTVVGSFIFLTGMSFLSWGVQMVGKGQPEAQSFSYVALALLTVIPVALITYSWLATLYRGSIACAAPTTFVVAFLLCGGIGAVMGLFLSSLSVGNYLANTMFSTAHAHYVMMGGVMTAFLAGLHFWWPKMTGRMYNNLTGRMSGFLYLIGLNLAFFPQIIMGAKGAPAGSYLADPSLAGLQKLSGLGMVVLAVGLVIMVFNLVRSMINGPVAVANPWGATTLEWQAASPPSEENFAEEPVGGAPYNF